jgi:hypothetical protein
LFSKCSCNVAVQVLDLQHCSKSTVKKDIPRPSGLFPQKSYPINGYGVFEKVKKYPSDISGENEHI